MTVFLDLDGPLLDTEERNFCVFCSVIEQHGCSTKLRPDESWDLKRSGKSSADLLERYVEPKLDAAVFSGQWLTEIESSNWLDRDRLQPGANAILSWLAQQSRLVLITLRQRQSLLHHQLQKFDLLKYFDVILCGDPTAGKGWEMKRQLIAPLVADSPGVIVGDSEIDIRAGKLLSMPTIAVSSGIRSPEYLQKEDPDALVENLTALKDLNLLRTIRSSIQQ